MLAPVGALEAAPFVVAVEPLPLPLPLPAPGESADALFLPFKLGAILVASVRGLARAVASWSSRPRVVRLFVARPGRRLVWGPAGYHRVRTAHTHAAAETRLESARARPRCPAANGLTRLRSRVYGGHAFLSRPRVGSRLGTRFRPHFPLTCPQQAASTPAFVLARAPIESQLS